MAMFRCGSSGAGLPATMTFVVTGDGYGGADNTDGFILIPYEVSRNYSSMTITTQYGVTTMAYKATPTASATAFATRAAVSSFMNDGTSATSGTAVNISAITDNIGVIIKGGASGCGANIVLS